MRFPSHGLLPLLLCLAVGCPASPEQREIEHNGGKLLVTFEGDKATYCVVLDQGPNRPTEDEGLGQFPTGPVADCKQFLKEYAEKR